MASRLLVVESSTVARAPAVARKRGESDFRQARVSGREERAPPALKTLECVATLKTAFLHVFLRIDRAVVDFCFSLTKESTRGLNSMWTHVPGSLARAAKGAASAAAAASPPTHPPPSPSPSPGF